MSLLNNIKKLLPRPSKRCVITAAIFLIIGGIIGGRFPLNALTIKGNADSFIEKREGGYRLINPLLECDISNTTFKNRELMPFKYVVENLLKKQATQHENDAVSVYFRELNDGSWFSIGETEQFIPASLRKLPLLIALMKQGEFQKGFLQQKVEFQLALDYNTKQSIKPSDILVPGREYTIDELLYRMIVYSDNNAFIFLTKFVNTDLLDSVYSTLRIQNPQNKEDDLFLSVQTYASFFRILYNATYLNREMSDRALAMLAQADFRFGLVAGVPPEITVAHKFGESYDDKAGTVQLHDCGIVYYPEHPYLLCIMSKGTTNEHLDDVIASVSQTVFAEVDRQHREEN